MVCLDPNQASAPRSRPTVALCVVGVWFSSGCNLGGMLDDAGRLAQTTTYRTVYEDTFIDIARRNELGYVELVSANPEVDPWLPGAGTELRLPTVHLLPDAEPEGIIVNLADMRLYYFEKKDGPPRSYPIGIGREGLVTPLGSTTIVRKQKDPTWRPTERMRRENPELPEEVPPGPDNPLGHRALYLGWSQYRIHGTNKPPGVGRRTSSGCVRMYPEDIEELYDLVPVGTKVTVVDQPIKFGWIDGELFMEAHTTQAQSDQIEEKGRFDPMLDSRIVDQVIRVAGADAPRLDWSRIRSATVERRGYPIRITR
jgi:L,D-transpeptidase ErfK/SrfK